jgi:citrate lyase subunit beta / citryl-CoA lyase
MRSKLFVPGSRPELFEKAWLSDADALSFDLEDAVAPESKSRARDLIAAALDRLPRPRSKTVIVRVNPVHGPHFGPDLDAVVRPGLDVVNVPKVEEAKTVQNVVERLEGLEARRGLERRVGLLVNIETPRGLRNVSEIAASSDRIVGLQLGFGDLFAPLGIERSLATLTPIWLAVRLAAGEAGIPAYDGAFVRISDTAAFREEARAARAVGFAGKTCVHPSQVPIANSVFFPADTEIEAARRVVAAADEMEARGVGAFALDGVMFDGPFIARAREIVRIAEKDASHV